MSALLAVSLDLKGSFKGDIDIDVDVDIDVEVDVARYFSAVLRGFQSQFRYWWYSSSSSTDVDNSEIARPVFLGWAAAERYTPPEVRCPVLGGLESAVSPCPGFNFLPGEWALILRSSMLGPSKLSKPEGTP